MLSESGSDALYSDAPNQASRAIYLSIDRSEAAEAKDHSPQFRKSDSSLADAAGPPTAAIHTHGCKLNQADSEALIRRFAEAGYRIVEWSDGADVLVLNTCTITATADAKARQALRGASRRTNGKALVVATGCYAQRAEEQLAKVDGVSLVVGNTGKDQLVATVTAALDQTQRSRLIPISVGISSGLVGSVLGKDRTPDDPPDRGPLRLKVESEPAQQRTRAMIKIQEGCDQVCAYCIVPKVRGRERSIQPDDLLREINQRIDQGCQEVVLTGTQLGTYGFDLGVTTLTQETPIKLGLGGVRPGQPTLAGLLQRILRETSITRLRVSSLQPQEITEALLELWSDPRLCPHFHLPLQSGCDQILKSMRRRYDTSQFAAKVEMIRKTLPSVGITTDLIVGFPGEGPDEYRTSKDFARSMEFSDIHVFPYSPRPGTSAAYLKDTATGTVRPGNVKKERVAEMVGIAADGFRRFRREQIGSHRPVLWESSQKGSPTTWNGLTDNYIRVRTQSDADLRNVVTQAKLLQLVEESVLVSLK